MGFIRTNRQHTIASRISAYEEEPHLFLKFFDVKSFIIMAVMMTGGIWLQSSGVAPDRFIAFFYTGLGASLLLAGLLFLSALARALYLPGTSDGRTLCAGGLAAFALCLCWELPTVLQTLVQEGGGALLTPTLLFRLGLCCVGALGALSAVRCTRTAQDA